MNQIEECFENTMPTYKGYGFYIAFAPQKNYFTLYTERVSVLEIFQTEMHVLGFGKAVLKLSIQKQMLLI